MELVKDLCLVPPIPANRTQIQQVIVNLCNNAMDAMPHGGKLTVCLQKTEQNGAVGAVIQVADTGQGMSLETQKKIFNPFFTTKEIGKGVMFKVFLPMDF